MTDLREKTINFAVAWVDRFLISMFYMSLLFFIPLIISLDYELGLTNVFFVSVYLSAGLKSTYMTIRYGSRDDL